MMMLMLELRAAAGLPYPSQPLSEARRRAQRLVFAINVALMLIYTSLLASLPLFMINSHY